VATEYLVRVKCDACPRYLTKPKRKTPLLFEGETPEDCERAASTAASKAGWYVDAWRCLCQSCTLNYNAGIG
jgi:hypothetical protein